MVAGDHGARLRGRASDMRGRVEGRSHGASHRPHLHRSLTRPEPLRFQLGEKAFALMAAPVLRRPIVSAQPGTLKGVRRSFGSGPVRYGVFAARIISAWIAS